MAREIQLTQGKVAIVDDEDYERVMQHKWCAVQSYRTWYATTNIKINGQYTIKAMHQLIRGKNGTDHIDGDGLNNRRNNLRGCTPGQNAANNRKHRDGKYSRYKGVCYQAAGKRLRRWFARIVVNCKQIYLGFYATGVEAARAYDVAAIQYFGEYARLNFPPTT